MAITQDTYNGNGSNLGPFSFTFKWLESTDIKVSVGGVLKTAGNHYNLQGLNYTTKTGGQVLFTAGNAPPVGTNNIRIYRDTDDEVLSAVFSSGSAIRAKDLNDNFTQNLYVTQETNNNSLNVDGSNPMVGPLNMNGFQIDNLATPTSDTDAVNRAYVNDIVANGIGDGDKGDIIVSGSGSTFTIDSGAITNSKVNASAGIVSSKLAFTQSGTGAVQRTVESKLQEVVSVLDFIPQSEHAAIKAGTSTYDATAAIQAAIDSVAATKARATLLIPGGKYRTTNTLVINQPNVCIIGLGMPSSSRGDDSSNQTLGSTIRYYGTGTAIRIGLNPGNSGAFIEGVRIENLRIEVDNNTLCALHVWHASGAYFKNIKIFGNKGANRYGLEVRGGINNLYENVIITGLGQTPGANATEYLYAGLHARLGYNNDAITTTLFRNCYFHYCDHAVFIDYQVDFEDCVFEASRVGVQTASFALSSFTRCWWEANTDRDFYLESSEVDFTDCEINAYTRQSFGSFGSGANRATFRGTRFITSDPNPLLVPSGQNICQTDGSVIFSSCSLPTNFKLGGSGNQDRQGYDKIVVSDMRLAIYRFKATGVTGAITSNPMPTEGGLSSYTMPTSGHMLGLNIYASAAVSAGAIDITTKLNGNAVANFSYPFPFNFTSFPASWKMWPYQNRFNAGDVLDIYFHTSGISPTVDFTYEVIVALGPDGL